MFNLRLTPHQLLILITFSLLSQQSIGLSDFFKVGKSVNSSGVPIDIIVETSFDLSLYTVKDHLLTGYEGEVFSSTAGKEIFAAPIDLSRITNTNKFKVTGSGLHQIFIQENGATGAIVWEQQVYVPYPKPFEPSASVPSSQSTRNLAQQQNYALAKKYMPITAYFDGEEYFPQSIDEILNFSSNNINIATNTGTNEVVSMGTDFIDFLTNKGHAEFIIHANVELGNRVSLTCDATASSCQKHFLRDSTGKKRPLTVYYTLAEISNKVYLSYHYIYAFDMKTGTKIKPAGGAHLFDRESLTLILSKNNGTWQPDSMVYGAHLASVSGSEILSQLSFSGCLNNTLSNCTKGNTELAKIKIGKTKLNWQNIPKLGDHPIIQLAQGSHAIFPVYGYYSLNVVLDELAGNISDKYTFYPADFDLIELDTNQDKNRALIFSGYWVDGLGPDSRFPPFIRSPQFWTADAGLSFEACKTDGTCAPYFAAAKQSIKEHAVLTGRITNIGNSTVSVSYNGSTYYETETDADGRFSLIVPADNALSGLLITDGTTLVFVQHYPNTNSFTFDSETLNNGNIIRNNGRVNLNVPSATTKNIGDIDINALTAAFPRFCNKETL